MKIVGLPGVNAWTEQWLTEVIASLEIGQSATTVQSYRHWQMPGSEPDIDFEVTQAAAERPDFVVAKSMGTMVALRGQGSGALEAERYVLIGVPVSGLGAEEKALLERIGERSEPCLFIQQRDDRAGSAAALAQVLGEGPNVTLEVIPGDDHRYEDIPTLKRLVEGWCERL